MNRKANILRGRPWLLLAALFAWLLPQRAAADDTYVEDVSNYSVMLTGSNVITIEAPACDFKGTDTWISDGNVYAEWTENGTTKKERVLYWAGKDVPWDGWSNSDTKDPFYFKTETEGYLDIKPGDTNTTFKLTKDDGQVTKDIYRRGENHFDFSADWVVPYKLLGKEVKFTWKVERNISGAGSRKNVDVKSSTIKLPEAAEVVVPVTSLPMLNPDSKGVIEIPWFLSAKEITKLGYEYTDANGNTVTKGISTQLNTGTIQLTANEPHRNFRMTASYYQEGTKGKYLIENVKTDAQNIPVIHAPTGLNALFLGGSKAKVELSWNVPYLEDEDLAPTDFFEIQRSLTGREGDFVTVHQEYFAKNDKKSTYSYIDSTLVDEITAEMLTNSNILSNLTYRVRRTITKEWGWDSDNNCSASTKCKLENLHLLRVSDYSAKWEDERAYSVRVSWNYGEEDDAVWDNRARMKLRVIMKNREGVFVDSMSYTLSQQERQQRYKVVTLSRPCVKYDIEVYVERGDSPFDLDHSVVSAPIAIHNASDWHEFAVKVNNARNQYDVSAILYADITTSEHIGNTTGAYFRGTLDGNGHTVTFTKSDWTQQYIGLIRYAGDATISNLHVAGTINTNSKFAAGLIGQVVAGSTVTIESCRSSVTINSSVNGDASNGGFISIVNGTYSQVIFRNCKFDGSFKGADSSCNGGFVGWSNRPVTINNSLFAPSEISTKLDDCHTWARGGNVTLNNSYATQEYSRYDSQGRFVIRSASDWDTFRAEVQAAASRRDVNAIMYADISVTQSVGQSYSSAYRGTFDGNGHTLNVDLNNIDEEFIAPFQIARGNVTIKNLHVTGNVRGEDYSSGLLGDCMSANSITIERVWVSASIFSKDYWVGGFIGYSPASINMTHCRFDGRLESNQNNATGGAFICYMSSYVNQNYVYENGTYGSFAKLGLNYVDGKTVKYGPLTISAHNWEDASHQNITDQNTVVDLMNGSSPGTWTIVDGKAVPVMNTITEGVTEADLKDKFSSGWRMEGDKLVPDARSLTEQESDVFHIRTTEEWDQFRALVAAANGHVEVNACLDADISVTQSVALTESTAYCGTFNGNGHTLTVNISGGDSRAVAPFSYVTGRTTFSNLHVTGTVKGGVHSAGLVGQVQGSNLLTIERVWVSTNVTSTSTHAAGIIGHVGAYDVKMTDVLFDGKITTNNSSYTIVGCIIGWGGEGNWEFHRVYDQGWSDARLIFYCINTGSGCWSSWGKNDASTLTVTQHDWGDVIVNNTNDQNKVLNLMNAEKAGSWQLVDGKAVPVMTSETSGYSDYLDFYHKNTGTIEPTLMTTTRQSSVLLAWNTDGNPIDYFKVLRRAQGEGDDAWEEVATDIDQMSYEDKTVSPLTTYEYKVLAVNDCEGISTTETQVKVGECKHTGRVDGYVRFNDGTGAPDINVDIYYVYTENDVEKKELAKTVKTDEGGYFEADELSYQGKTSVDYKVVPVSRDGVKFEVDGYLVTFNATSNDEAVHEFIITNGRRFSGYVMYDGTSIPVKGVNFLVNGRKIHNNKGDVVETDYDGSFSFRLVDGDNSIQAVMDNHVFVNDGWYKNSNKQHITSDVSGIYFYDATKVKLTGRIVGGDDQGLKPLGNNLSINNLGDSIQIVLTLEGDNTSWLVYDNLNPNRTQREEVFPHKRGGAKHYTSVKTQRKRMEVTPDLKTGEYELMLPPVRWKVQQVYCKGYPTLFQEGQVSEVIDLTNCLTAKDTTYVGNYKDVDTLTVVDPKLSCHAIYNRIYHAPVEVTYKQMGYDTFDYFGDKEYSCTELTGKVTQVPLAYPNPEDTTQAVYSFRYPVFSMERKYMIQVQVAEMYRYNNDARLKPDMVRLGGGMAYMQNGMKAGATKEELPLDSLGRATFTLKADQMSTLLTEENALKTVTFTVERDGSFFEATPLQGYVLNMFPVGDSWDILADGQPVLFDILRDPPGAYSSNTLAKGATLNSTYMMNMSLAAGLYIDIKSGSNLQVVSASVAAPAGAGTAVGPISLSDNYDTNIDMLMYNADGTKAFSYTMAVGNNISTSGDPSMVGADADLYIGAVQNVSVMPMSAIRAVTDSMYNAMKYRQGQGAMTEGVGKYDTYGTLVKIAEGRNEKGDTIHLIRDVALGYGPKIQSNFVYSQKQLLTQIIPAKAKEVIDLMFIGTKEEAQTVADYTRRPVYLSLREPTDSMFAVVNSKKPEGHAYNTKIEKAEKGINYLVVLPTDADESKYSDEVAQKYSVIKSWLEMIAQNEGEKLGADDLLTNYDVAGAAGVNYSETFDSNYSTSFGHHFPIATEVDYFGLGAGFSNAASAVSLGATIAGAIALSLKEMKAWTTPNVDGVYANTDNGYKSRVYFSGNLLQWTLFPVISYNTIGTNSETKAYNRTESFTIACDPSSHLSVDVYRVKRFDKSKDRVSVDNIFTNDNFNKLDEDVYKQVEKDVKAANIEGPSSFVFRTRGGSTQNPWEDQRVTKIYKPGTELDARTMKICNPKIRLDKQSVSGVRIDEAAKFTVFISNESEKPEALDVPGVLQLFVPDQLNPLGAKISVNGQPLTSGGMTVTYVPGAETALSMEVRAGQGFDYNGLAIGVMSPADADNTTVLTSFDVHFLREAGGVSIAVPGDKWVLNTSAQKDSNRGWYIPVTINGFDRHQHNFDHIEFQYKESQRGDDSWTNLCSFYASDSLMANANGVRKLIPENGNIVTEFYGEGWTMEREYDLRAVLFCRNGSDFLTTASKVVSGIKDTRRPQLFGTPEPKSGLLTAGDDIVFNFSEDIEYNYLSAINNFEVKGEVNNNSVSENVSVQFAGQASVETEAKRNFSGKDLTIDLMVKPEETGREMPLFSHGTNGSRLQLWLTSDFRLKAVVNDQEFFSNEAIGKNAFHQVAMVLNQTDSLLTLYNGGVQIGSHKLNALYNGTGTLIFGRTNELDRSQSQYYEGRMMEARLWYSALDGGLIGTTYGSRRLTGYEKDLVDYYPMNEGSGLYVKDCTQGANALMMGASWAIPHGLSLRVQKSDKGVLLDKNALNRTADQDYSLMFWFRTDADGRGTLLSNGRGLKEDNGGTNLFHIGFEPGIANPLEQVLMYRSNGFATEVPGNWSDGQWHNFAMTVSRGRNVANIYMDKELVTTFEADSLGGISGGYPLIGATRYNVVKENGEVEVIDGDDALTGNVDELMFFAQALPEQLIKTYTTKSPNGDEAGLLTYLGFDRQERQKDNSIELVPYAYSKKLYLDDKGQPRYQLDPLTKEPTDTLVRDYLFADSIDVVMKHFDAATAAPVVPYEEVTNLKFGFIGRGNQLLVELDELAAKLHHRNIHVTVRDIEDKNGNTMASPQTACFYVANNSLEWLINKIDYTIKYGSEESVDMPFCNNGSSAHTFTIENCPKWLKLNKYTDKITPLDIDYVTATVSKDLNVGSYSEIIYLTDEEGISEPFYLNLTVEGDQPDWAQSIDRDLLKNSMSISGQVYLYKELDKDSRDIVGAFDNENVCHGFANITHDVLSGETGLYLTVYDNQDKGRALSFRLWQYSTGREIVLTPEDSIKFDKSVVLGTDKPVRFDGGDAFVQYFNLQKGWNWVSFNVSSKQLDNMYSLLTSMPWKDGDIITDLSSDSTLTYKDNQWWATHNPDTMDVSAKKAYAIMVQEPCSIPIGGTIIKAQDERTIGLKQGWNGIGYTPALNLTVETALSDYYDHAETGDVIKSQTEFAYYTKAGNTGRWRGSLKYMKPGEGYMLLRKGAGEASFTYPFYEPGSTFLDEWAYATSRRARTFGEDDAAVTDDAAGTVGTDSRISPQSPARNYRFTMNVSAIIEGFDLEDGDRLVAYTDGEPCGVVAHASQRENSEVVSGETADRPEPLYLSIGGKKPATVTFAIERDGDIVAIGSEQLTFRANDIVGTPDEPFAIHFADATGISSMEGDFEEGQWYTTNGVKLAKKPTRPGVYIYNNSKVVIKK